MRRKSFEEMHCSVAQTLEVVGEWWTMLIIRDCFLGITRFDEFHQRLGISRNILTERLDHLVGAGVLTRVPYQSNPVRHDYRLTDKGRDLWLVLTAMREWGDRWAAEDGPPVIVEHKGCDHETTIVPTCSSCGEILDARSVRAKAGPGSTGMPTDGILAPVPAPRRARHTTV
jgi:DNA-binding HxlR family transcriptional regulator